MKKDTFNYNMRLFYERWKWFFVNAYFIIGIALLVCLLGFVGNCGKVISTVPETNTGGKEITQVVEPKSDQADEDIQQTEDAEQQSEGQQLQKEQEKQQDEEQIQDRYVLMNKTAMADRVSAAMLVMVKDAVLIETKKEIDNETRDYIFNKAEKDKIDVFVVGGTYVISENSFDLLTDNENIESKRISGVDMQGTVLAVLEYIKNDVSFTKVYVANIVNADSCDIAYEMVIKYKIPVLPVDYSGVSDDVLDAITQYGVEEIEFIGDGISDSTRKKFADVLGNENVKG